jgi:hypothetical protein
MRPDIQPARRAKRVAKPNPEPRVQLRYQEVDDRQFMGELIAIVDRIVRKHQERNGR